MSSKCYKAFVWCLLTSVLGIVCDPDTSVNYKDMNKWLKHSTSVLIHGNRIELEQWSSSVSQKGTVRDDLDAIKMYTFIKCECAYFVHASVEIINNSIIQCMNGEPEREENDSNTEVRDCMVNAFMIPHWESLNEVIQLTLAVLFDIMDAFPALRSTEPYFLKTLLMTSLYVHTLTFAKDKVDKEDTSILQLSVVAENMKRVALQISNLVGQYDVEYCYLDLRYNNRRNSVETSLQELLTGLRDFLKNVVSFDISPEFYPPMDRSSLFLEKCMRQGDLKKSPGLQKFCAEYLPQLPTYKLVDDRGLKYFDDLWDFRVRYDVETLYMFTFAVYSVILKSLYRRTHLHWKNEEHLNDETLSRLRSMNNCPIDITEHFDFTRKVERYKNEHTAADLVDVVDRIFLRPQADDIFIFLSNNNAINEISLSDLAETVLSTELKHFWQVFNILTKVMLENKSREVYDTRLKLVLESDIKFLTKTMCDELKEVYHECFNIESISDGCLASQDKTNISYCLSRTIPDLSSALSAYLFEKLNGWGKLSKNSDLYKIFVAAIIILNTNFKVENINRYGIEDLKQLLIRKHEKLIRTVGGFLNTLDNYQIRNCPIIWNRKTIYAHRGFVTTRNATGGRHDMIPRHLYDFVTSTENIIKFLSFGNGVLFNWHGEDQSMTQIRKDVSDNMLNIYDLVEYQRLYVTWVIYVFYKTWSLALDRIHRGLDDRGSVEGLEFYERAMSCLDSFHKASFPKRKYTKYLASMKVIVDHMYQGDVRNKINGLSGRLVDNVEELMVRPMCTLLGVVNENHLNIADINIIVGNSDNGNEVFSELYSYTEKTVIYINSMNKNFMFLG